MINHPLGLQCLDSRNNEWVYNKNLTAFDNSSIGKFHNIYSQIYGTHLVKLKRLQCKVPSGFWQQPHRPWSGPIRLELRPCTCCGGINMNQTIVFTQCLKRTTVHSTHSGHNWFLKHIPRWSSAVIECKPKHCDSIQIFVADVRIGLDLQWH